MEFFFPFLAENVILGHFFAPKQREFREEKLTSKMYVGEN